MHCKHIRSDVTTAPHHHLQRQTIISTVCVHSDSTRGVSSRMTHFRGDLSWFIYRTQNTEQQQQQQQQCKDSSIDRPEQQRPTDCIFKSTSIAYTEGGVVSTNLPRFVMKQNVDPMRYEYFTLRHRRTSRESKRLVVPHLIRAVNHQLTTHKTQRATALGRIVYQ